MKRVMERLDLMIPVAAFFVMVLALIYTMWVMRDQQQEIDDLHQDIAIMNCESINETRLAYLEVLEESLLPPRPVPRGASDDLLTFIEVSNERSERLVNEFRVKAGPIDCEDMIGTLTND